MSEQLSVTPIIATVESPLEKAGCVKLCGNCPRKTGEINVRQKGLKGILRGTKKMRVHDNPLSSGEIHGFGTNGTHGILIGEDGFSNSGTVTGLTSETIQETLHRIATCEGPVKQGNICSALGLRDRNAMINMAYSMEKALDSNKKPESLEPIRLHIPLPKKLT